MSSTSGATDRSYPTADLDRRFYAFTLDRLLAWTIYAVAVYAAYALFLDDGRTGAGIAVIVGTVVVVGVVLSFVLGLLGATPGKAAVGLRVVDATTGRPIGVGPALLRTVVLGLATLPTLGLGVATLAWTAMMDRDRLRRGWHDHLARSVVVDVRPAPVEEDTAPERPRSIVNLTAMRLAPASPTPPRQVPARVRRSRWAAGPSGAAAPEAAVPARSVPVAAVGSPLDPPLDRTPQPAPAVIDAEPAQPAQPAAPAIASAGDPADALTDPLAAPVVEPAAARSGPRAEPAPGLLGEGAPQARHAADAGAPPEAQPGPTVPPTRFAPEPVAAPAPAVPARWSVTFDTGDTFVVDGFTIVGRNPEPRPGEPVKRMVALASSDMSLSKTHAQFQVVPDGALVVMDRGSTNGSILVRAGVSRELGPGRPATLRHGDVVRFGDREMRVVREA